jgi:hypothetical protein
MTAKAFGRIVRLAALLALVTMLMLTGAPPAFAQTEDPVGEKSEDAEVEDWAADGRNEAGVFLGATGREGEWGFSVGFDYEFRLTRLFGIGGVIEWTGADFREGIAAVPFILHPWHELKLIAAPGIEITPEYEETNFLVRAGAEYGFDVGYGYELAPALYADITSGEVAVVIGGVLAWKF